jgi:hypothetical protein
LPPETPVYAADGARLRRRTRDWAPRLGRQALFVGSPSRDSVVLADRAALLRELAGTYRERVVATPWYGCRGEYVTVTGQPGQTPGP